MRVRVLRCKSMDMGRQLVSLHLFRTVDVNDHSFLSVQMRDLQDFVRKSEPESHVYKYGTRLFSKLGL